MADTTRAYEPGTHPSLPPPMSVSGPIHWVRTNLHCHAFQRGMAGLAEVRGPGDDSFWTWRELMYRFVDCVDPEGLRAIAALAYAEMLESGFTRVGEFHYLHHDPGGATYADPAQTRPALVAPPPGTGNAPT